MKKLQQITDQILIAVNERDDKELEKCFDDALKVFKESHLEEERGHAGFGGWDDEYDYSEFMHQGLVYRFEFTNSDKKRISVIEIV